MPDGLYRPYFHGELVAEYRKKSVTSNGGRKSISDVETPNQIVEQAEEYVEPGIYIRESIVHFTKKTGLEEMLR